MKKFKIGDKCYITKTQKELLGLPDAVEYKIKDILTEDVDCQFVLSSEEFGKDWVEFFKKEDIVDVDDSYSVVGTWVDTDGHEEFDVLHDGPLSHKDALKVAADYGKIWRDNVTPEYKNMPHKEALVQYKAFFEAAKDGTIKKFLNKQNLFN